MRRAMRRAWRRARFWMWGAAWDLTHGAPFGAWWWRHVVLRTVEGMSDATDWSGDDEH